MATFKRILGQLMTSALFWIIVILATMMAFILRYERPVNFVVDKVYHLF